MRYVEKLATPDVTIADMVGDIDPIKAARAGLQLSSELTMHYGLLPRANRGIFAINELPDLAGKIQVGLFNILQEGDVQIKGYPVRLPLDVLMAFTANPEDYTARGKIITPLKDRIGSEIRTHYPAGRAEAMAITAQEAWMTRNGAGPGAEVPAFVAEVVEEIAFQARQDRRIDKRSGVSQRLPISVMENVLSNAERRALMTGESLAVPRVTDVYAALPSITGKFEMEYEGELKGAEAVARELIRAAVALWPTDTCRTSRPGRSSSGSTSAAACSSATPSAPARCWRPPGGAGARGARARGRNPAGCAAPLLASGVDFVLEGLYATKKISRSEERGYHASNRPTRAKRPTRETLPSPTCRSPPPPGGRRSTTTDVSEPLALITDS
jgi:magnesium chelatase subunit I